MQPVNADKYLRYLPDVTERRIKAHVYTVCAPLDAIFEATAGFTGVGASLLTDPALLPKGLLFAIPLTAGL